jgi:hypothetical protein
MSTSILTRWRKAFTTDEDGNDALRTVISGDQNLGGGYITNEQTTTNMMSKGTVYRFDGTDDVITVTDSAEIQDIFANGGFISARINPLSDGEGDNGRIIDKSTNASGGYALFVTGESGGYVAIRFLRIAATTNGRWTTGAVVPIGKDSIITVQYDDSAPTTEPNIYINGVLQTIDGTTIDPVGALVTDVGDNMIIGSRTAGDFTFDGTIGEVMLGNFIPSQSEIKDLISGNLPYKWQYGSQTELIADVNDRTFAAASNWVNASMGSYSEATNAQVISSTGAGQAATLGVAFAPMVTGKAYRLLVTASGLSGDAFALRDEANAVLDSSQGVFTPVAGVNVYEFVYTGTTGGGFRLRAGGTGSITLDDYSLVEIGAVAHYTQDSITANNWFDLANGNTGAVTGASVLNPRGIAVDEDNIPLFSVTSGITASTGSSQGDGVLTSSINQISTCGTAGDAVTLPSAKPGKVLWITNDGAEAADVFPASGDNIDEAGANTAKALPADGEMQFICTSAGHWTTITSA